MRVLVRNAIAFGVSALVSLTWTRAMDHLAVRGLIDRKLCRKIVHIGTGCLYMLMWPLYSTKYYASRLLCASIPLAFSAQVTCIGLGLINDSTTVAGMTRTGNKRELLVRKWIHFVLCWKRVHYVKLVRTIKWYRSTLHARVNISRAFPLLIILRHRIAKRESLPSCLSSKQTGPLLYSLVHGFVTIRYWTASPTGILSLVTLCCGDGFADIIGRRFGSVKWPHSKRKSLAGSFAFFVASTVMGVGYMHLFGSKAFGLIDQEMPLPQNLWKHAAMVSFVAAAVVCRFLFCLYLSILVYVWFLEPMLHFLLIIALIDKQCSYAESFHLDTKSDFRAQESLPIEEIDNLTVVVSALIASSLLL